jgi:HK97 family phage prohead protease
MSNLYVRAYFERAEDPQAEVEGGPMRFTASTEGVARDGLVIQAEGWKLENYRKNPVVLWAHDYLGRNLPIGRAVNVEVDGKRLVADVMFDPADEFARAVERKYRTGYLSAVSVGWETRQLEPGKGNGANKVTEAELLDISAVPVPGDPDALMEREYRALQEIRELGDVTPEGEDAEGGWRECAAEMVDVFALAPDDSDEARLRRYQRLLPKYRRLGKTPPEFRKAEELRVLGAEEIRGLFFHGEGDLLGGIGERAGAVLNARNRGDLEQAVSLIQTVLERAKKEEVQEEERSAEQAEPEYDETELILRALRAKSFINFGGLK